MEINTVNMEYNLLLEIPVNGELFSNKNEIWYVFVPEQTGSYEIICKGDSNLCGSIYNETKEWHINGSYVANIRCIRLASTLKRNKLYYIKIHSIIPMNKKVKFFLSIVKIKEPNVSGFKYQWGLLNKINGLDINILPVWKYTTGANVKIGIADTGTDYTHKAIKDRINLSLSYNFVHNLKEVFPQGENDTKSAAKNGHGTHAAGIICASHNMEKGVVGIAPKAEVVSLKVMGSEIEDYPIYNEASDSFIKAIEYAQIHNIRIINCSFSGNVPSKAEKESMLRAKDILFVIAAGNNGVDLSKEPKYPACYYIENSIVVTAIDNKGQLYLTSNYGGPTDVAAPGSNIISTYLNDKYVFSYGTSVATPFVTAVCGLVWSLDKHLTPIDVKRRVLDKNNVTQLESLHNKVLSGGLINAYKAVISSGVR